MKRFLIALFLLTLPTVALALTPGSNIERTWSATNTSGQTGLKILGGTFNMEGAMSGRSLVIAGTTRINNVTYVWPSADGNPGQAMTTNGAGVLSFATILPAANTTGTGATNKVNVGTGLRTQSGAQDFYYVFSSKNVGIGKSSPAAKLDVVGTISGSSLNISSLQGCTTIQSSAIGLFSCGSASTAATGFTRSAPYVFLTTSTDYVGLGTSTPKARLSVIGSGAFTGTLSGSALNIQGGNSYVLGNEIHGSTKTPTAKLEVVGVLSGTTLNISGLQGCATMQTSATGLFSCGSASSVTAGQGLMAVGNSLRINATLTGSTLRGWGTISGTTLYAGAGTVSLPSLTFGGDTNTGLYWIGPDVLGIATGGAERMRLDASGNVGIGTTNTVARLSVVGTVSGSALNITTGPNQINGTLTISGSTTIRKARICRILNISGDDPITSAAVGTGGFIAIRVDESMDRMTVSGATIFASTSGTTGLSQMQIKNVTQGNYLFSSPLSLGSTRTSSGVFALSSTPYSFNKGDILVGWNATVASTPPKGLTASVRICP